MYGCVDDLKDGNGEGGCFTSTRLRLGNGVSAFAYLDDRTGLNC